MYTSRCLMNESPYDRSDIDDGVEDERISVLAYVLVLACVCCACVCMLASTRDVFAMLCTCSRETGKRKRKWGRHIGDALIAYLYTPGSSTDLVS